MTIRETAKALGLKPRTIREWIKTGRIEAHKGVKCWDIPNEVVESKEVQERADKGREHSRRIAGSRTMGVLARANEDSQKSV